MIEKIKQKILRYRYKRAREIYIIGRWARWGVLSAKFTGKIDKDGNPLTIHYTDHNGYYERYYIGPWYTETTGHVIGYSFNKEQAQWLADKMEVFHL